MQSFANTLASASPPQAFSFPVQAHQSLATNAALDHDYQRKVCYTDSVHYSGKILIFFYLGCFEEVNGVERCLSQLDDVPNILFSLEVDSHANHNENCMLGVNLFVSSYDVEVLIHQYNKS
jgi:hypothetical protein